MVPRRRGEYVRKAGDFNFVTQTLRQSSSENVKNCVLEILTEKLTQENAD